MLQTYCVFSAGSANAVATSQNIVPGVPINMVRSINNLNIRGNQQSFNFSSFNRPVTITASTALTGVGTITITGSNTITGATSETISTISGGTDTSVNTYSDLSTIIFNLLPGQVLPNPIPTITVGMGTTGIAVIPISTMEYFQQVSVAANITSGTMTYTVAQTLDNCLFPTFDYLNVVTSGSQFWENLASMSAATTSKIATPSDIKIPIAGLKITVSASTGAAVFTILQQGAAFR